MLKNHSIVVSKLEDIVANELKRLNIAFDRQAVIRNDAGVPIGAVDFFFYGDIAWEINGTFWHADPRVYPNGPVYEQQRRTVDAYNRKVKRLEEKEIWLGELWEIDIKRDLRGLVERMAYHYCFID